VTEAGRLHLLVGLRPLQSVAAMRREGKDMVDYFGCKLDFLMRVVGVKNSVLARALNFDPSYISRVRAGKRGVSGRQDFIDGAACFLARNIRNDLQRAVIVDAMGRKDASVDASETAELIAGWLGNGRPFDLEAHRSAGSFTGASPSFEAAESKASGCCGLGGGDAALFYGDDGKRQAVLAFLSDLVARGEPVSLLLHSDEDMLWLTGDEEFAEQWSELLLRLLNVGSTIKIVHTVSRDIGEMLEGMRKWIPLYATGRIEPFYCPKLRDGIFRRTLFVADGVSAVSATSCGSLRSPACLYAKDGRAVEAFSREFAEFLTFCEGLGKMHGLQELPALVEEVARQQKRPGRMFLAGGAPLLAAFSQASSDTASAQPVSFQLAQLRQRIRAWAEGFVEAGGCIVDVVDVSSFPAGNEVLPPSSAAEPLVKPGSPSSPEDRSAHLEAARRFAQEHEGYHLLLCRGLPEGVSLVVSENSGAIVSFAALGHVSMMLEERRLVQALGEYLDRMASESCVSRSAGHGLFAGGEPRSEAVGALAQPRP
jgi:hypothetical protein